MEQITLTPEPIPTDKHEELFLRLQKIIGVYTNDRPLGRIQPEEHKPGFDIKVHENTIIFKDDNCTAGQLTQAIHVAMIETYDIDILTMVSDFKYDDEQELSIYTFTIISWEG
jgi:hypothetical protein